MHKRIKSLLFVLIILLPILLAQSIAATAEMIDYEKRADAFVQQLLASDFEGAALNYSIQMKIGLPPAKLKAAWESTIENLGSFVAIEKINRSEKDGYIIILVSCAFEQNGVLVQVVYNKQKQVAGLFFQYYEPQKNATSLPDGLSEIDILLGEGTRFPLKGKITSRSNQQAKTALVLVHGSGPQDMDETIFTNKPFRDIAWQLASQGIDVLRYDKRTYAHVANFTKEELIHLTAEQETIEDAISAAKFLKEKRYQIIYLAGHSLGGMLAARIEKESENLFSGLIIMAGSPRTLTDLILDQNTQALSQLTDSKQVQDGKLFLEAETAKLNTLSSWTEAELQENTVFGMSGFYIRDLLSFDTATLINSINKPILILQGSDDFQVYADKDFVEWKNVLSEHENAEFVLYEGLNHLFMTSQGQNKGTVQEYQIPGTVDKKVINDMVLFIQKQGH